MAFLQKEEEASRAPCSRMRLWEYSGNNQSHFERLGLRDFSKDCAQPGILTERLPLRCKGSRPFLKGRFIISFPPREENSHSQKHKQVQNGWNGSQEHEFETLAFFAHPRPQENQKASYSVRISSEHPQICLEESNFHALVSKLSPFFLLNCLPPVQLPPSPGSHIRTWPSCSSSPVTCHGKPTALAPSLHSRATS